MRIINIIKVLLITLTVAFVFLCMGVVSPSHDAQACNSTIEIKGVPLSEKETPESIVLKIDNKTGVAEIVSLLKRKNVRLIIDVVSNYNMKGEKLELTSNCILKFSGGILYNGTLVGNNTCIDAPITEIFGSSIMIEGEWNVDFSYPEWFGAKGDGLTDDRLPIQQSLNSFKTTRLMPHRYLIGSYQTINNNNYGLVIPAHHNLVSEGMFDLANSAIVIGNKKTNIGIGVNQYVTLRSISILGYHYNSNTGGAPGVVGSGVIGIGNADYGDWVRDLDFENVVSEAFDTGYKLMAFSVKFRSVWSRLCNVGFHFYSTKVGGIKGGCAGTTISLMNCYADHIYKYGYLIENMWYSQMLNCSCDRVAEINSMGKPTLEQIKESCAYKFVSSSNCSMISCGAETTYKVLDITGSNNSIISMQCYPADAPDVRDAKGNKQPLDIIVIGDGGKTKSKNNYILNFQVNRTNNQYKCNVTDSDNDICTIDYIINPHIEKNNQRGSFEARPSASKVGEGALYYDSTNKRMILSNGKKWVNLDGSPL